MGPDVTVRKIVGAVVRRSTRPDRKLTEGSCAAPLAAPHCWRRFWCLARSRRQGCSSGRTRRPTGFSSTPLTPSTTPDGTVYTGLLPNCPVAGGGPCHNRSQDKLVIDSASPVGYDIVLVANIPAATGDPRMA